MQKENSQFFFKEDVLEGGKCKDLGGFGLQISNFSIRSSMCGFGWTDKSDPWRFHLTTYQT